MQKCDDQQAGGGVSNSPEPLAAEAGHGEDPPVDEDAELGLVVPHRQRSGVDGVPGRLVFGSSGTEQQQHRQQGANSQPAHSDNKQSRGVTDEPGAELTAKQEMNGMTSISE